jgi:hypothetical protein
MCEADEITPPYDEITRFDGLTVKILSGVVFTEIIILSKFAVKEFNGVCACGLFGHRWMFSLRMSKPSTELQSQIDTR